MPLAALLTATVALFTTPPFGSLTITWRSPVAAPWASPSWQTSRHMTATQSRRSVALIRAPKAFRLIGETGMEGRDSRQSARMMFTVLTLDLPLICISEWGVHASNKVGYPVTVTRNTTRPFQFAPLH